MNLQCIVRQLNYRQLVNYHHKPYPHSELPPEIFRLPRVKKFLLPNHDPKKVIDYFMYFNEVELLELRYHMLKNYVDLFVVSESNVTFSGKQKGFTLQNVIKDLGLDVSKFRIIENDLTNVDNTTIEEIDELGEHDMEF